MNWSSSRYASYLFGVGVMHISKAYPYKERIGKIYYPARNITTRHRKPPPTGQPFLQAINNGAQQPNPRIPEKSPCICQGLVQLCGSWGYDLLILFKASESTLNFFASCVFRWDMIETAHWENLQTPDGPELRWICWEHRGWAPWASWILVWWTWTLLAYFDAKVGPFRPGQCWNLAQRLLWSS